MTDAITSDGRDPHTVRADRDTRGQFIAGKYGHRRPSARRAQQAR
jgi:hypothetical protein